MAGVLVHHWKMQDNLLDSVGTCHLGEYSVNERDDSPGAADTPTFTDGTVNRAWVKSAGSYLRSLNAEEASEANPGTGDFSVSLRFLFNATASGNINFISSRPGGTGKGWSAFMSTASVINRRFRFRVDDGSGSGTNVVGPTYTAVTTERIDDGVAKVLLITVDRDGNVTWYLDDPDTPLGSAAIGGETLTLENSASSLCIGTFDGVASQAFGAGWIDDVRFYTGIVDSSQRTEIMTSPDELNTGVVYGNALGGCQFHA